jgi:hypothetical protein
VTCCGARTRKWRVEIYTSSKASVEKSLDAARTSARGTSDLELREDQEGAADCHGVFNHGD